MPRTRPEVPNFPFDPLVDPGAYARYGVPLAAKEFMARTGYAPGFPEPRSEEDLALAERAMSTYLGAKKWGALPALTFQHIRELFTREDPKFRKAAIGGAAEAIHQKSEAKLGRGRSYAKGTPGARSAFQETLKRRLNEMYGLVIQEAVRRPWEAFGPGASLTGPLAGAAQDLPEPAIAAALESLGVEPKRAGRAGWLANMLMPGPPGSKAQKAKQLAKTGALGGVALGISQALRERVEQARQIQPKAIRKETVEALTREAIETAKPWGRRGGVAKGGAGVSVAGVGGAEPRATFQHRRGGHLISIAKADPVRESPAFHVGWVKGKGSELFPAAETVAETLEPGTPVVRGGEILLDPGLRSTLRGVEQGRLAPAPGALLGHETADTRGVSKKGFFPVQSAKGAEEMVDAWIKGLQQGPTLAEQQKAAGQVARTIDFLIKKYGQSFSEGTPKRLKSPITGEDLSGSQLRSQLIEALRREYGF